MATSTSSFPGRILLRELDARNMSQSELARRMGRPFQLVNGVVRGRRRLTPPIALDLERALSPGPSAEFWMTLEVRHRLRRLREKAA